MAVKIGHSSVDERGRISGGVAGDQTKKEVCTRDFYNHSKGWWILRANDPEVAEKIAKCMEDICANDNIGYDQNQRLSLYDTVKSLNFYCDINTLKVKVESDCSSAVRVCLAYAGIHVANFTTANEKDVILATGRFTILECKADGSNLKRGDILVTKTKGHTVVVLTNSEVKTVNVELNILSYGSKGEQVKTLQRLLKSLGYSVGWRGADGDFGSSTKKAVIKFQKDHGLTQDGVVGLNTWNALLK